MTAAPEFLAPRPVPPLTPPRRPRLPTVTERTLANGLRAVVVRRASVPLVQVRLRVPFASRRPDQLAKTKLLERSMLLGTATMSTFDLAVALQEIGGALRVSADADRLSVRGEALRAGLPRLLELLTEVVTEASYPRDEVTGEAGRLQDLLRRSWSEPAVVAGEALVHRMYDGHAYGRELPRPEEVSALPPAAVRTLHRRRVAPAGSLLVLVGDVSPSRTLDAVEKALSAWDRPASPQRLPAPPTPEPGPLALVDRPGAVQSNVRLGGPALRRTDDGYAALVLANLVFGGYFASRLVANIREDKGYTYSPHSRLRHAAAASAFVVDADVATEVTAPAMVEIAYELGRIATLPVSPDELESAQRYATGSLALSTASQAGLAATLEELLAAGLDISWLREHPARLAKVTADEVLEQASRFLAPAGLVDVVVGDAERVEQPLRVLGPVTPAEP